MSALLTRTPLAGRVAVVSGASSGIGAATAVRLAELGAKVAVLARREDKLDSLVATITGSGGTAVAVPADVTDRDAVHAVAQRVADELGTADLVFNNAGVQLISPITDLRQDDWQRQIDLNVTDPDASALMADLVDQIDVLRSEDVAETVAFIAAVPRHVNLTEITILPTAQAV